MLKDTAPAAAATIKAAANTGIDDAVSAVLKKI